MNGQRWFEDVSIGDRFESPSKTLTDAHSYLIAYRPGT